MAFSVILVKHFNVTQNVCAEKKKKKGDGLFKGWEISLVKRMIGLFKLFELNLLFYSHPFLAKERKGTKEGGGGWIDSEEMESSKLKRKLVAFYWNLVRMNFNSYHQTWVVC